VRVGVGEIITQSQQFDLILLFIPALILLNK
jgi:hypothetical protein